MTCPYCDSNLSDIEVGTKNDEPVLIHECYTCGGHWLPRLVANGITEDTAEETDSIITHKTITPPLEPRCPECKTRLSAIRSEAVPQSVIVWACPNGHGNFFPKGELYKFKKAQEAKITYHQLWGIPTKSVIAVLLPVLAVLAVTAGLPITLQQLQTNQETRSKASSTYTTPVIVNLSDTSRMISFSTSTPAQTSLTLYEDNQFKKTIPVSAEFVTTHKVNIDDLDFTHQYTYTLTITYQTGTEETSPQTSLP